MDPLGVKRDETLDDLFGGRIRVLQKRTGYRLSMDPILLAHFASPLGTGSVIDLGTGSGIIPIILATRGDAGEVIGLEIQAELVDMARRSVQLNGLEGKVRILCGDYRDLSDLFPPGSFRHVLSNPPYHPPETGRSSPRRDRAFSRHERTGSAEDVIRAARYLLPTRGRLWLTYTPTRLVRLLALLQREGLEPKRLRMVHGRRDTPARMLLLEAIRGGRESLEVLPPLILYRDGKTYTEELEEIYRMI